MGAFGKVDVSGRLPRAVDGDEKKRPAGRSLMAEMGSTPVADACESERWEEGVEKQRKRTWGREEVGGRFVPSVWVCHGLSPSLMGPLLGITHPCFQTSSLSSSR